MKKVLLSLFLAFAFLGCDEVEEPTRKKEQRLTEANQQTLLEVQPPVRLEWSLERDNINRRTELWNDRNKVAYLYIMDYGKIIGYYVIKGKVSSVNSQVTNPEQQGYSGSTLPSPAEDGSYGTNGDAIFFFLTDGTYVEYNGRYLLSDRPLKMNVLEF